MAPSKVATVTIKTLSTRLERIEAARRPAGRLVVCSCATANRRENLPSGVHLPDCPARTAGDGDNLVIVRYEDRATAALSGATMARERFYCG